MNPAPGLATAPPAGVATMLRCLLDRWGLRCPATRATLEPPEDHDGTAYWQDPAFWLWMVR